MKVNKSKKITILLFALCNVGLQAQVTLSTAGGGATGSGGSLSYTIGQVVYTTMNGTTGSIAQGVQHAFEISGVPVKSEKNGIRLTISAFPNPTTDYLILKINTYNSENFEYKLFDSNGKLLDNKQISDKETIIKTTQWLNSTYYLSVYNEKSLVKTFKILKNRKL